MSALPTESSEVFRSPHLEGSSGCHAVFHPFGDLLLVPDDRARAQPDLLGEGPVVDAGIDVGLPIPVISRTTVTRSRRVLG